MIGNEIIEISDSGMKNYFRDKMKDNPNNQKLGCFDPFNNQYTLSFTNQNINPCYLSISPKIYSTSYTAKSSLYLFSIVSNSSWTLTISNLFLTINTISGFGNQDIWGSVTHQILF